MGLPPWASLRSAASQPQHSTPRQIKPLPTPSTTASAAQLSPALALAQADAPPNLSLSELNFEPTATLKPGVRASTVQPQPGKQLQANVQASAEDGLFGVAGQLIGRSLLEASTFSTAGLFGALPNVPAHPLRPALSRGMSREASAASFRSDDSPALAASGVGLDPLATGGACAMEGQGGEGEWPQGRCNKKKRKVPVAALAGFEHYARLTPNGEEEDGLVTADAVFGRKPIHVPANPPRTAEAALAKLRQHSPHISIVASSSSRQKADLQRERPHRIRGPLDLPAPPVYHPPARVAKGAPPLPTGSGLKGSKAVKAAIKAEKEREAERKRILREIGAENFQLVDLFDPTGEEKARREQLLRLRKLSAAAVSIPRLRVAPFEKVKIDGYPTPPPSSDESDDVHEGQNGPFWLEHFSFAVPPSQMVIERWEALQEQLEQLRFAEERAQKAREEERERRLDKARKTLEELEQEANALSAGAKNGPVKAPPPPKTRLPPSPTRTASQTMSPRAPSMSPTISREELPPLPPQPPSVKPKKKGNKKRSAHANANNPHFKSNYVPSRMPTSGPTPVNHHDEAEQLTSWPASQEAIDAAARAPARRGHASGESFFAGAEEWLCDICTYEAFYGEEPLFIRAIKRREELLKRRKKAQKKAAAKLTAAEGEPTAPAPAPEQP